jgi:hemerythrin-like domain-containing protein
MHEPADVTFYYLVHRMFRDSAADLRGATIDLDPTDRRRAGALAGWFHEFADQLHHHHTAEDEIAFPALAERVPVYAEHADDLARDHERLDEIVTGLTSGLRRLADGTSVPDTEANVVRLAAELYDLLDQHLAHEDADIVPLFARHFTNDEFQAMNQQVLKSLTPRQVLFTVPWFASMMTGEELDAFFAHGPKFLPLVWRMRRRSYCRRTSLAFGHPVAAVRVS